MRLQISLLALASSMALFACGAADDFSETEQQIGENQNDAKSATYVMIGDEKVVLKFDGSLNHPIALVEVAGEPVVMGCHFSFNLSVDYVATELACSTRSEPFHSVVVRLTDTGSNEVVAALLDSKDAPASLAEQSNSVKANPLALARHFRNAILPLVSTKLPAGVHGPVSFDFWLDPATRELSGTVMTEEMNFEGNNTFEGVVVETTVGLNKSSAPSQKTIRSALSKNVSAKVAQYLECDELANAAFSACETAHDEGSDCEHEYVAGQSKAEACCALYVTEDDVSSRDWFGFCR